MTVAPPPEARPPLFTSADVRVGLAIWLATSVVVVGSVVVGWLVVRPYGERPATVDRAFLVWDGGWYESIAESGYSYSPDRGSNVAFFPAYPLVGRAIAMATGTPVSWALTAVSLIFTGIDFVLFHAWARRRFDASTALWATLILALYATTFCFRMAHSEAMFLAVTLAVLTLLERKAPLWLIALAVGLATATRPVGVGLLLPVIREAWVRSPGTSGFILRCVGFGAISCWGLLLYMTHLQVEFDEPLAFAKTQRHWTMRPDVPWDEKVVALMLLKPIWGAFIPGSAHHAGTTVWGSEVVLSPSAGHAAFFLIAAVALVVGLRRRWLTWDEGLAGVGLLLVPYVTRGYESRFLSFARFAAVVAPTYLVFGAATRSWSPTTKFCLVLLASWVLAVAAMLYAAGYAMI